MIKLSSTNCQLSSANANETSCALPIIVFSQFAGTSLWFARNAIINDIQPASLGGFANINKADVNVSIWSFIIIATGGLGCILGGIISQKAGSKNVAFYSLLISGICCLLSPFIFHFTRGYFLLILLVWGLTVVSDSPQLSTLVAQSAPAENKGTALTIVTSIGFAITIASIQLLKYISDHWKQNSLLLLFIGPFLGLLFLRKFSSGK